MRQSALNMWNGTYLIKTLYFSIFAENALKHQSVNSLELYKWEASTRSLLWPVGWNGFQALSVKPAENVYVSDWYECISILCSACSVCLEVGQLWRPMRRLAALSDALVPQHGQCRQRSGRWAGVCHEERGHTHHPPSWPSSVPSPRASLRLQRQHRHRSRPAQHRLVSARQRGQGRTQNRRSVSGCLR